MSSEHFNLTVDDLSPLSSLVAVAPRDFVRWNGFMAQVVDVAHLGAHHDEVVLQRLDRPSLPISMPMSDFTGAEIWHFTGELH